MLVELRVTNLGVIDDLTLVVGSGMTALTGETGAGKTMVVEAIDLLLGGRADPVLVRPGADEAVVEGRFEGEDGEVILTRVIPSSGRSRGYLNGRMAPLSALAEAGQRLVDIHGQHAHQALFSAAAQRSSLDRFGRVDHAPLVAARRALAAVEEELAGLGGDERSRAHELDLLRFQLAEIDSAALCDPDEESTLVAEEQRLSGALAHRQAATAAHQAISAEAGALDRIGAALAAVAGRPPLESVHNRLRAIEAELTDVASEARSSSESFEEDPARLAWIGDRRHLLRDLRRKYGDTVGEVIAFASSARSRVEELEGWQARAAAVEGQRSEAQIALQRAAAAVGSARRAAAPKLAKSVEAQLRKLAMPRARFEVSVGDDPSGDEVTWMLGANAGESALPLAKVASGGELARTMLALRLVTSGLVPGGSEPAGGDDEGGAGRTLVFDEVDAGIGGEAAIAVGEALGSLAAAHQVLVVTHLPQVAAFADHQVAVSKKTIGGRTVATCATLDDQGRIVELSRMLSGRPDSPTARSHAEELLEAAGRYRKHARR